MNARTSWSARKDQRSASEMEPKDRNSGLALEELLDARFDEEGRLAQIGRGNRQRIADRLDPRPPALSADELELAVQKLAEGLDAIERQSAAQRSTSMRAAPQGGERAEPAARRDSRGRDFVTHSLDRLEARLEMLSRRLQERAEAEPGARREMQAYEAAPPRPAHGRRSAAITEPPLDLDPDYWRADPSFAAEAKPEMEEASPEAVGRIGAEQARHDDDDAREARHRAEAAEAERRAETDEAARRAAADAAAEMKRQFAALESRIEALQQSFGEAQVEPVRRELLELLHRVEDVGRDGRSVASAVAEVSGKLDQMETKLNAARNMTGNRLSELNERLAGIAERLVGMEAEVPGFDALRENQSAILERFDRMEGLVHRLASPEDLLERVDGLRRQMQTIASQREVARIEEQILHLADRLDALPDDLSDRGVLERIETQLQALAGEFAEARNQRSSGAAELHQRLADLSAGLTRIGETDHTPDLSGMEQRLAEIASRLDDDRRFSTDALGRLDRRLGALTEAVEKEEDDVAAEILSALTGRMDALAEAIEAQDARGARRDLQGLDSKLDQLARSLGEQAEHLSRPQMEPLEARLEQIQAQLDELSQQTRASNAQFGPFAQKLHEISERVSGLGPAEPADQLTARLAAIEERLAGLSGRGPDARALQTQLEGVVSRLELLKGRSIDPARVNELFDRVDAAMRAGIAGERFDRLEKKLDDVAMPVERFDRLEKRIAEGPRNISEDRFARLEEKLESIGRAYAAGVPAGEGLMQEDFAELRNDIVALRRELRSLPGLGDGEANLASVLTTISARLENLPQDPSATAAALEAQIERLAQLLEEPGDSRLALAHIETSLRTIEARLEETRRTMLARPMRDSESDGDGADVEAVAGLARALSDDVTVLKGAADASERKTKDALEALQGTLEAVVKRMAFLERDADAAATGEPDETPARPDEPVSPLPMSPTSGEPPVAAALQPPPPRTEPVREPASGGLFSRFTSSQLLRRATGGRADSFSPESDEADEAPDLPLEPGTDAPLDSALTGAPSSDTALMSGARGRGRSAVADAAMARELGLPGRGTAEPVAGDDFLAAARRAAKEAAVEAAEAEREAQEARQARGLSRVLGLMKGRRRVILTAALAVAVAVAALQMMRARMAGEEAALAEPPRPAATERAVAAAPAKPPIATEPSAPAARRSNAVPEVDEARFAPDQEAPPPPARVTPAAEEAAPPVNAAAAPRPSPPPAAQPDAAPAPTRTASLGEPTSSERPAPADMSATRAVPEPSAPPAASEARAPAPTLPAEIGPAGLRDAALAGDPVAAFEVAARYAEGRGTAQDLPAAIEWYVRAAEAGLAPAQYRLGSIYEKGTGVPKDAAAAQEWYRRAADAGNVKAMHNLAVLYAEGAGGAPDLDAAADLFREAAEHGVRDSQFNLAILHARGLGVPQDMIEAYKWFAVAASSGDAEALKRRDIIGESLSESELAKAQAAAAGFEPLPLIVEANDVMMPSGGWREDTTSVEVKSQADIASENDMVALVQKLLAEHGYDPGPADGLLGRQTIEAIADFQERIGLPKTGQIDNGLVAALQEERPT